MENNDRFTLQPSREQGSWVATDKEHGIVITFKEHRFNDTQKVTLLDGDTFSSMDQAMALPTYLREMADWLRAEHYNKVMPSMDEQRARMGQRIRELRLAAGLTQEDLAQLAGITRSNLTRIEAGRYSVGLDILNRIANALGTEVVIK